MGNKAVEPETVKVRIPWIDMAKGILILFVLLGHVQYFAHDFAGTDDFKFVEKTHVFFITWYMPAFFVIAGYCSNFNISFKDFFLKNLKSLIIPSLLIGVFLSSWISLFLSSQGVSYYNFMNLDYWSILVTCGPWFLPALFIAKMIMYGIRKYVKWKDKWIALLLMGVMLVASALYNKRLLLNVWYFEHALLLLPFLFAGILLRKHSLRKRGKDVSLLVGVVFLVIAIILKWFGMPYPYIVGIPGVFWGNFWLCVLMGVSGAFALMVVCEKIGRCSWLEFLGRHTITIYLLQESIMVALLKAYVRFHVTIPSVIVVVLLVFMTAFVCAWIDVFINKHVPFLKGKF